MKKTSPRIVAVTAIMLMAASFLGYNLMVRSQHTHTDAFKKHLLKEKIPIRGGQYTPWYLLSEKLTIQGHEYYLCKDSDVEVWRIFRAEKFEMKGSEMRVAYGHFRVKDATVDQRRHFDSLEQLLEYVASFK